MKKLVICGGGSSAHTLIPFLKDSIFEVSILTSKPDRWSSEITLEYQDTDGQLLETFKGNLKRASNNPKELIPEADYVVLCMPVHKYRVALHEIAPFLNKDRETFIGAIYGQGGFNWMVDEIRHEYSLNRLITFSFGLIPWICRIIEYGHTGVTYGCKAVNVACTYPHSYFLQVKEELLDCICYKWFGKGSVLQSDNFLSFTLSVDNQIIHPSRCLGLYQAYGGSWEKREDVPMFYRDYDDVSAYLLKELDADYTKIRNKIKKLYPEKNFEYMLDYLALERLSYHSANTDIKQSFVTSKTLVAIGTPVIESPTGKWELDRNNRFFLDDIYYGNCIAKWIAEKLDIDVPTIDKILRWAQDVRSERIIDESNRLILDSPDLAKPMKSGIPYYYGHNTINEVID